MNTQWGISPLKYDDGSDAGRLTLIDPTITPPDPKRDTYFADGVCSTINGRKSVVAGASDGAASFIDYVNSTPGVKINFMTTRADLRRQGYGALLLEHFMLFFEGTGSVEWIDFGDIMHDAMEKLYLRWRRLSDAGKFRPRVYGKL